MSGEELPDGWAVEELGDVMEVKGGSQPPKSHFIYEPRDKYIQLLQIRDFGNQPVSTYVPEHKVSKFCKKDDVLIARYGASLGRIVTGLEGAYNVALAKTIFDNRLFYGRFIFYLLQTSVFQEPLKMISRSAQNGFAKHEIAHIKLPIPPLNEQKRIVAKIEKLFSKLDKGIESLKLAQEQLKVYRQAVLKQAFEGKLTAKWREENKEKLESADELLERIKKEREGQAKKLGKKSLKKPKHMSLEGFEWLSTLPQEWKWERLGWMTCGIEYGTSTKSSKSGEVPVLRMGNIQNMKFDWDDLVYTSEEKEISSYSLQLGDVLFNRTNSPELVGKTAIYKGERPAIFAGYLMRVNQRHSIVEARFLNYYLNSHTAKQYGNLVKTDGVNQSNINGEKLANYPFPYCSIYEQHVIADLLDVQMSAIDQTEIDIAAQLKKSEALRQSILKKAFSGQLVPQDPDDEPASVLLERIRAEKEATQSSANKTKLKKKTKTKDEKKERTCNKQQRLAL